MRSGSMKHDSMAQDAVDQEPVRVHMALGEPGEIAFEGMFSESLGQRLAGLKQCENVFERLVIESVPGGGFGFRRRKSRSKRRVKTISFTAA